MSAKIDMPAEAIEAFCRQHRIRRLSLFGSVLRDDFSPESDVDILVSFEPTARVGLIGLAGMEIELSQLLGRKAEIHTEQGLNPRMRGNVLDRAVVCYEHA